MAKQTAKKHALDMFSSMKKDSSRDNLKERGDIKVVKAPEEKLPEKDIAAVPVSASVDTAKKVSVPEVREPEAVSDNPGMNPPEVTGSTQAEEKSAGIDFNFRKKKKVKTKDTHTFYFSIALYDKLKARAEANGANVSEFLEYILEQVL